MAIRKARRQAHRKGKFRLKSECRELFIIRFTRALAEVLFPSRCMACGSFFNITAGAGGQTGHRHAQEKIPERGSAISSMSSDRQAFYNGDLGAFVCACCAHRFAEVRSPLCPMCGAVFKSREGEDHICEACIRSPRRFHTARAAGIYKGTIRKLIHRLKYNGKIQLARPLGRVLHTAFSRFGDASAIDSVIPVPLHIRRFRERGFNQTYLLVRDWTRLSAQPRVRYRILPRALVRHRPTLPQSGLGRKMRIQNVKNAFSLSRGTDVGGQRILLVDDIFTTGTTVEECARVLLKGGAERVDVLTLARTQ